MDRFDELVKKLNSFKLPQMYLSWDDNIPTKVWDDYFYNGEFSVIATEIDIEKHRWYETSMMVVKIFNRYLGIRHVSKICSDSDNVSDTFYITKYFEVFPVKKTIIEYKTKGD